MCLLWRNRSRLPSRIVLLATALAFIGCSQPPRHLKPGPLFTTPEEVPPAQAQIYFYWPAEEQSRWQELTLQSCEGEEFLHIQRGGYTRSLTSPGRQCFIVEGGWSMESINAFGSVDLTKQDLDVMAGQTLFVRVEQGRGLPFTGTDLRPMEPAKAEPEIKRCGQMIAMTEEEMLRERQARETG